ncbi:MAG: metallophosphoesterase family protein [Sandaracinus sp.]
MSALVRATTALACIASLALPGLALAQARRPYLQRGTPTSMHVVWRSAAAEPTRVCWGTSASSLGSSAGSGASEIDHDVTIEGLSPSTQYFYRAAAASCSAATTGDANDTFTTSPPRGSTAPFRMWIVGDSGTGDAAQAGVRDAMLAYVGADFPDLVLHMGDIAYTAGTTAQFDSGFFGPYADILRRVPCWPTMGNHEGISAHSSTETGPYYEAYSLPRDGSAGGVASGTEAYYSFDYANVHFVVLNSQDVSRSPTGAMLTWLESDLSANVSDWTIAYFHHPAYTHGTHNSDTESQLVEMRENALPILEAHGVDAVLAGHSHAYERSYLVHGAYDTPTTAAGHVVDPGDGQLDGDGAYHSGPEGALYVVAGHGGASTGGSLDHPLMFFSESMHGSCIVDVDGDTLTLTNVRTDGTVTDHVSLTHAGTPPPPRDGGFVEPDASTFRPDAGPRPDAATPLDGAVAGDDAATTAPPPASGGCGCAAAGTASSRGVLALLLGLVLAARVRQRARRQR